MSKEPEAISSRRAERGTRSVFAVRLAVGLACAGGLAAVFIFQRTDIGGALGFAESKMTNFIINRTVRFLLNDLFAIGLIYALFVERKYIIFSLWVQLAGVVLFLLPYFLLKFYFPSYNGPLINFLHRLIMNPILLLLLIPAFYYQASKQIR